MIVRRALVVIAMLVASCARYRSDVEAICSAKSATSNESEEWIAIDAALGATNLKTQEGKQLLTALRDSSKDPAKVLAHEAELQGVAPCAMADTMAAAEERARYRRDVIMLCGYEFATLQAKDFTSVEGDGLRKRLAQMTEDARAAALGAEAKRIGLAGCARAH